MVGENPLEEDSVENNQEDELVMTKEKSNVIRGRFRLGENAFPSSREKTERIMKKVEELNNKWTKIRENQLESPEGKSRGSFDG